MLFRLLIFVKTNLRHDINNLFFFHFFIFTKWFSKYEIYTTSNTFCMVYTFWKTL